MRRSAASARLSASARPPRRSWTAPACAGPRRTPRRVRTRGVARGTPLWRAGRWALGCVSQPTSMMAPSALMRSRVATFCEGAALHRRGGKQTRRMRRGTVLRRALQAGHAVRLRPVEVASRTVAPTRCVRGSARTSESRELLHTKVPERKRPWVMFLPAGESAPSMWPSCLGPASAVPLDVERTGGRRRCSVYRKKMRVYAGRDRYR